MPAVYIKNSKDGLFLDQSKPKQDLEEVFNSRPKVSFFGFGSHLDPLVVSIINDHWSTKMLTI